MTVVAEDNLIDLISSLGPEDEIVPLVNVMDVFLMRLVDASLETRRAMNSGSGHGAALALVDGAVETVERLIPEYRRMAGVLGKGSRVAQEERERRAMMADGWLKSVMKKKEAALGARANLAGAAPDEAAPVSGAEGTRGEGGKAYGAALVELELIRRKLAERW